jgi:hypothetical protein
MGHDAVSRQANAADNIFLGDLGVDNDRLLWVTHDWSSEHELPIRNVYFRRLLGEQLGQRL